MNHEKTFTCAVKIGVLDEWNSYVERCKKDAESRAEKVTGKLLIHRALVEYMERHPIKRKGK